MLFVLKKLRKILNQGVNILRTRSAPRKRKCSGY